MKKKVVLDSRAFFNGKGKMKVQDRLKVKGELCFLWHICALLPYLRESSWNDRHKQLSTVRDELSAFTVAWWRNHRQTRNVRIYTGGEWISDVHPTGLMLTARQRPDQRSRGEPGCREGRSGDWGTGGPCPPPVPLSNGRLIALNKYQAWLRTDSQVHCR